jgi:hypothetical protein
MFSEREEAILKILGRKKMTYQLLAAYLFFDRTEVPLDAEISVGNCIRRIIAKCDRSKLKWTLTKRRVNGRLVVQKVNA